MKAHALKIILGLVALSGMSQAQLFAQAGNDNPYGVAGEFNGQVTTGCSYDPYTGNATRTVTDLVVAGSVGAYPLQFTRIANTRGSGVWYLQDGGNWRHNYAWSIPEVQRTAAQESKGRPTSFLVLYPDGREVDFQPSTNGDPYYRGLPGVRERLAIDWNNSMFYLLLPDGGQVTFSVTRTVVRNNDGSLRIAYYDFTLKSIIDPYGLATTITATAATGYPDGTITQITELGGNRWIQLVYGNYCTGGFCYPVLDHISASDGRSVYYHYSTWVSPGNGNGFIVLSSVSYFNDSNLTATYTYQPDNVNPGGGPSYPASPPLLGTCDDPMYPGPMRRIAYRFAVGKNSYGVYAVSGQIQSENYYDGNGNIGAPVSTLTFTGAYQTGTTWNYTRTETRGDSKTRNFTYSSALLTSWTDFRSANRSTASQTHDSNGFVNSITDFAGNTTNYTRDHYTGVVTQIMYPATPGDAPSGRGTVNYNWVAPCSGTNSDPNNCNPNIAYYLYSVTDEAGNPTYYFRDGYKRVVQINNPDGGAEGFVYDYDTGVGNFGQVVQHRLTTGGTQNFSYDTRGLLQMSWDSYHSSSNPNAWYQYDTLDRLSGVTDALGSGPGDINHTTNYQYNSRNQVTTTTHPVDPGSVGATSGHRYTVVNDYNLADGTLKSVTDELLHVTSFTYDDYRRLTTVTTPGHNTPLTANVCYDDQNYQTYQCFNNYTRTAPQPTKVISPGGRGVLRYYDEDRLLGAVVLGLPGETAVTSYGYDWNGNVNAVVTPNDGQLYPGTETWIVYDQRNRPMSVQDALGSAITRTTKFTYDAGGRKYTITRPNGQVTTFTTYDHMNRLLTKIVKQSPSPDAVTNYGYYTSGLLSGMQTPNLVGTPDSYGWGYDLMGRKTEATYPLASGGCCHYEAWHYDTAGRVDKFTNRAGSVETPTWDALNRLTSTSWNDGITPGIITAQYDVANRPVSTKNANATVAWAYFNDGLINTETLTALSDPARTVTYQYNDDSLRSNVTYPGPAPRPAFSYNYTSRNQLDNISDSSSMQWVKYLYDLDGNRQHRKLHNAATDTVYGTADALDRIPSISTAFTSGGTASFNYGFDAVSRLQYEQRNGGVADGYTYDLADQIIGFNRGGTLQSNGTVTGGAEIMSLAFDANGNRVSTMDNNVMKSYAVNELNQYTQDLNGAPTYDTDGNLAGTGDGWAYTYDAQNRLTHADQSSTNTHVIYYYDPLNRQVARNENGVRTYSVWDGWSLIQEYNGGGTLLHNYLEGAGMDEMVTRFGANNASRVWYYQDGRGNTSHVADDTGALVETYTYDLGGKPFITTAAGKTSPSNRFLYNGRDYSSFTGLYDFRNRFYHPATSRFIQSDPIGFAGGNHLYRFVGNSAVNAGDPWGLDEPTSENVPFFKYTSDQPPSGYVFPYGPEDNYNNINPPPNEESLPTPVFTLDRMLNMPDTQSSSSQSNDSNAIAGFGGDVGLGGGIGSGGSPGGVSMDLRSITEGSVGPVGIGNGAERLPFPHPQNMAQFHANTAAIEGGNPYDTTPLFDPVSFVSGAIAVKFASAAATPIAQGMTLYRVFGGPKSIGLGNYYTPTNPFAIANYRTAAGLFKGNLGTQVLEGTLNNIEGVTFGIAAPGPGGVGGGLLTVIVPNPASQITVTRILEANPPF